ncbi:MAG: hypothetical protein IIB44_08520 [Candidatus Marinimicrobia bacterium]|nr:hypothetical protein [Candidatus Neomarinimicrobiota bacterium]
MDVFKKTDVIKFLKNDDIRNEIIDYALRDSNMTNKIVEDLGDEIADILKDDPTFRQKLLSITSKKPEFREKIITKLIKAFRD